MKRNKISETKVKLFFLLYIRAHQRDFFVLSVCVFVCVCTRWHHLVLNLLSSFFFWVKGMSWQILFFKVEKMSLLKHETNRSTHSGLKQYTLPDKIICVARKPITKHFRFCLWLFNWNDFHVEHSISVSIPFMIYISTALFHEIMWKRQKVEKEKKWNFHVSI